MESIGQTSCLLLSTVVERRGVFYKPLVSGREDMSALGGNFTSLPWLLVDTELCSY